MTPERMLSDLETLAARVRDDLQSAGFTSVAPDDAGPEGGLRLSRFDNQVHVYWVEHPELGEAAFDMREAGRVSDDVIRQQETTRAAMHLALGSILNAFGYRTQPHSLGNGHLLIPDQT